MNPEIAALLSDGVASARQYPHLARALNSCACRGEIRRLLPGVYGPPSSTDDDRERRLRLQAVAAYHAGVVVTRRSAAQLTWWPDIDLGPSITVANAAKMEPAPGYDIEQRYIPPGLVTVRSGIPVTVTALTVLDLMDEMGPDVVDEALRRRVVKVAQLKSALRLSPHRRGNRMRREILEDSRDEPWSPLERLAHRLLRDAGIKGWRSNLRVKIGSVVRFLDVGFPDLKLGLEFDGEEFHHTHQGFHGDRERDVLLAREGWLILRFTTQTMTQLVETVVEICALRRMESTR
ncbi:Protein of unknown function [Tessaracoccus bendigoensis DSM 12906]|uniref:DUF559 domain-containing protein n=1 Tax=Tessaracoccus bendigoensis DSM 12906 TaxID=1123357 RepID=A0A1M6I2X8_9ACTN|nr:DUF559 domain-containing protein [Tessaracoccus bendigoensis]SHJ28786.1 Protein of unknown function [Tessaracoccus bendigoensis DSM 12906]